jgi:AcrR family transcriptional regulator
MAEASRSGSVGTAVRSRPRPNTTGKRPTEVRFTLADDRRRLTVMAADALLVTDGLEGLTIRKVLDKTRLSRRAFYERFSSKDELILAVFEHTMGRASQLLSKKIEAITDPMERLKTIVECIVLGGNALGARGSHTRNAALVREHLRLAETRPADLQAALSPLISLIACQLSDGMQAGLVRKYPPRRLAALVYNVVATTMHTEILTSETERPDPAHRSRLASEIWEFCRPAIAA